MTQAGTGRPLRLAVALAAGTVGMQRPGVAPAAAAAAALKNTSGQWAWTGPLGSLSAGPDLPVQGGLTGRLPPRQGRRLDRSGGMSRVFSGPVTPSGQGLCDSDSEEGCVRLP